MNSGQQKYTKLCSAIPNFLIGAGRQRVMIGDDHILIATRLGSSEQYRRFFLKDIRLFTVFKTVTGKILNVIHLLLLLFFGAVAFALTFAGDSGRPAFYLFLGFAALVFAHWIPHLFRGPTSKVFIKTLNSEDTIVISTRFNRTMKILRRIRPMIEAAQGGSTRAEVVERMLEAHHAE